MWKILLFLAGVEMPTNGPESVELPICNRLHTFRDKIPLQAQIELAIGCSKVNDSRVYRNDKLNSVLTRYGVK